MSVSVPSFLPSIGPLGPQTMLVHVPTQSVLSMHPCPSGQGFVALIEPPQSMPVSPPSFIPSVWLSALGVAQIAPLQKPDLQSLSSSHFWPSSHVGGVAPTPQG